VFFPVHGSALRCGEIQTNEANLRANGRLRRHVQRHTTARCSPAVYTLRLAVNNGIAAVDLK
jgi:hypothetical protein